MVKRSILTSIFILIFFSAPLSLFGATVTWTGAAGTSTWSTGLNWDTGTAPNNGDDVDIPDVTGGGRPQPVLDTVYGVGSELASVDIQNSATLDLNGNTMLVTGNYNLAASAILYLEGSETVSPLTTNNGTVEYTGGGAYTGLPGLDGTVDYNHLIFNGAGTWTLTAPLTTTGNLSISAGTLDAAGNDITVGGNWTNGSTFTSGANTVTFNGGGNQTVTTGGTGVGNDFNNFTVNKTAGTISVTDLDVDGTLTVTDQRDATFSGTVTAGTVSLDGTGGAGDLIDFQGNVTVSTDLDVNAGPYSIRFTGAVNSIQGDVTAGVFNNTGTLTLGDGGDSFTFDDGLTATAPGTISLAATISTTGDDISLGAAGLAGATSLQSAGGNITIDTVNNGNTFTVDAAGGTVTLNGALGGGTALTSFTLTTGAAVVLPAITATGALDVTAGGTISQSGVLDIGGTSDFTLTTVTTDIQLASQANSFGNTITFTDNGNVRDLEIRKAAGAAAFPTLPGGIEDLWIIWNTGFTMPSVATSSSIRLDAGGAVTQAAGGIQTVDLLLEGSGQYTLTDALNDVDDIAADTTADISYTDADNLRIDTVLAVPGITTTGAVTLTTGGTIIQTQPITATTLTLLGGGTYTLNGANNAVTNLDVDGAALGGNLAFRDDTGFGMTGLDAGTNDVTLITDGTVTHSAGITNTGTLFLTSSAAAGTADFDLDSFSNSVSTLDADDAGAAGIGTVEFRDDGGFSVAGIDAAATVTLASVGGTVTQTGNITGTGLELLGAGGTFTLSDSTNDVNDLAGNTGTVTFRDADGVTIDTVNTAGLTAGPVTITSIGAVTQNQPITATTLIVKTLNNGGAAITLTDVNNDADTVDLRARDGADGADAPGAIQYVDADGFDVAQVRTTVTASLTAAAGAITDSGTVTCTTLTTSSDTGTDLDFGHTVTGFTATNTGSNAINLVNTANPLTVPAAGITQASGETVDIENTGAIVVTGDINAGTGTVDLDTLGVDTLTGGGTVTGNTLNLQTTAPSNGRIGVDSATPFNTAGTTSLTMGQGNALGGAYISHTGALTLAGISLAADQPLDVRATGALTLPAINIDTGSANLFLQSGAGLTTAGDLAASAGGGIWLQALGGALSIDHTVSASNQLNLLATTGISQTAAISCSDLTAKTLNNGAADILLENAGNDVINTVDIQARNAGDLADSSGVISYRDTDGFTVFEIGTTTRATLHGGAAVSQPGGNIDASDFELLGTGPYTLTGGANNITSLAAAVTAGEIQYTDSGAFAVSTAGGTTGIDTNGNNLTLTAGGLLAVDEDITASSTSLTGNGVTVNAGDTVDAGAAAILIDANDGNIDLTTSTLTTTNATASAVIIRDAAAVTLGNITTPGTLTLGQALGNSITGNLSQSGGTALSIGGPIVANTAGVIDLSEAGNQIASLGAITRGGALTVNDSTAGLAVNGAITGGTTTNDVNITTAGGALNVGADISATGAGTVTLTGVGVSNTATITGVAGVTLDGGTGTITNSGTISSTDAPVVLEADDMDLGVGTIGAGNGTVTLRPSSAARVIDIGNNTGGRLGLTDGELDTVTTTGTLLVGDAAQTGGIDITATVDPDNASDFYLLTGGSITRTAGTLNASGGDLILEADSGIGVIAGAPVFVGNVAGSLNATNTTAGDLFLETTGNITLGAAVGLTQRDDGELRVDANGDMVLAGNLTVGGAAGTITLNATGTVTRTAGTVDAPLIAIGPNTAPDSIGTLVVPVVTAATTSLDLDSSNGGIYVDNTGNAAVTASSTGGPVVIDSTGSITLTGSAAGAGGYIEVNNTGTLSTSGNITAAAGETVDITSSGTVTVGHDVTGPGGLDLTVTDPGGLLDHTGGDIGTTDAALNLVADSMNLGGGGGTIASGSGDVSLYPNDPTQPITLGANVPDLGLTNTEIDAIITTGTLTFGRAAHTGTISTGGNVTITNATGLVQLLTSGGTVTLNDDFSTADNLTVNVLAGGAVTGAVNGTGQLTVGAGGADTLTVRSSTGINLSNVSNLANIVDLDNDTSGNIVYQNNRNMLLIAANDPAAGSITVTNNTGTLGTSGIITATNAAADITLNSAGQITLNHNVTAGDMVVLNPTGGGMTQTAGTITADDLLLLGAGDFQFVFATNDIGTLAADINGEIPFLWVSSTLTIGTVNAVDGITTGGNDIFVYSNNQMTVSQDITLGTGEGTLWTVADGGNQTGGALTAAGVSFGGTGDFTFNQAGNDVDQLASGNNGDISFTDSDDLTIGTVDGLNGISTAGGDITVNTGALLTLTQNLNAGGGTITLNPSAGGVSQTGGTLTAADLLLIGAGTYTVDQVTNNVTTLAADVTGSVDYRDADAFTVGTVGADSGIRTNGGDLDLITAGNNQITISEAIATNGGYADIDSPGTISLENIVNTAGGDVTIDADGTTTVTAAGDITTTTGNVIFGATRTGTLTTAGDVTTGVGAVTFTRAVTLSGDVAVDTGGGGGDITFASTLRALNDGVQAIDLDAGTGAMSFNATVGAAGNDLNHLRITGDGGDVTSTAATVPLGRVDVYLDAPGGTITPLKNVQVRNLYFYRGTLDLGTNNVTLESLNDVAVFGGAYDPDDADRAVSAGADNALFAYPVAAALDYYPADGTYNAGTGDFSTAPTAVFADLDGAAITVGANFYDNGADMIAAGAGSWFLNVQNNIASNPVGNPPWGSPYAVAFNMAVENSTAAGGWVSAAIPVGGEDNNNVADNGGNSNWDFTRPQITSAETVFDNVIRVTMSEAVENSSNELNAVIASITFDNGGQPFSGVYVDDDGDNLPPFDLVTANGEGDLSVFYLQINPATETWNTDADGGTSGAAGSTDRSGVHQTTVPNLDMLKGVLFSAEGKTMVRNYGHNGFGRYNGTVDECRPVITTVVAGRAERKPGSEELYDAHNYFHIRYSEPVDIGGLGMGDSNIRAEQTFAGAAEHGGHILDNGSAVEVVGYFTYGNAASEFRSGSEDANPAITSLFRASPVGENPSGQYGITLYAAGWWDGSSWPGYLGDPADPAFPGNTDPAALTITAVDNQYITDGDGNQIEPGTETIPTPEVTDPGVTITNVITDIGGFLGVDMPAGDYSGWDVDPPAVGPYQPPFTGTYEIITVDGDLDNRLDELEFHILDNESDGAGWDSENDHPDGYVPPPPYDPVIGIRDATVDIAADAFGVGNSSGTTSTPSLGFSFSTQVDAALFDPPSITNTNPDDDTYMSISFSDNDLIVDMLDEIWVSFDATLDIITDHAGNVLASFTVQTIAQIPPRMSVSLASAGETKVFIRFSEPAAGPGPSVLVPANFDVPGKSITGLERLAYDGDGTTDLFLTVDTPFTEDEILTLTVGPSGADQIFDISGSNAIDAAYSRRISDVGIGVIEPVWASDGTHADDTYGPGFTALRIFDGTGRLRDRDITLEASILAPSAADSPVQLVYDSDPPESVLVDGFWLPFVLPEFNDTANTDARTSTPIRSPGALRAFLIPSGDPEITDGANLDFLLRLGTLYCARLTDPEDPRTLAPWEISIQDLVTQRGGVTILNNVINPLNDEETLVVYDIATSGMVTVNIFTLDGSLVRVLQKGPQAAGSYQIRWDGTNAGGRAVARGIYFVRVVGPGIDEYRKVLVVK